MLAAGQEQKGVTKFNLVHVQMPDIEIMNPRLDAFPPLTVGVMDNAGDAAGTLPSAVADGGDTDLSISASGKLAVGMWATTNGVVVGMVGRALSVSTSELANERVEAASCVVLLDDEGMTRVVTVEGAAWAGGRTVGVV
jgi:hypothetical protein